MPWLLNLIYGVLLLAVSPVLLYRRFVLGKYRDGWAEKFLGRLPKRVSARPCVWLHAVSVGEVIQLRQVMRQLVAQRPDWEFVISTTTRTGLDVAIKEFGKRHTVCYFPLDFSWSVRNALRRIKPSLIVLVELELWPNFILAASDLSIPLALINGRVSEKSFRGYRRIRPLIANLLRRFSLIAAQNEEYADRLRQLGAPVDRLHVTGSIKFDGVQSVRSNPKTAELRDFFGIRPEAGEKVFIAGSTQAPEEQLALDTWQQLRTEFPSLRLILVPRHKERFEEVATLVESRGLTLIRRSVQRGHHAPRDEPNASQTSIVQNAINEPSTPTANSARHAERDGYVGRGRDVDSPVCLLDTLGDLTACWGLADIAFVGGSLTQRGGQNMLEPAAFGAAVLFGPNTWNFRDIVEQLLARDAARVVRSGAELTSAVRELLSDEGLAAKLGAHASTFVSSQQGATERSIELLLNISIGQRRDGLRNAA